MSNLLIVESPAKAKTIKKYLGSNYKVVASMGHVRDLPKSKMGIDIENGYKPQYISIRGKSSLINELKKEAKGAKKIYLATDPDREGEAISWHLATLLGLDMDDRLRVTFNEITKTAVTEGVKNPRKINMDLVDAQQARRVLDRLVGYEISPILWRKIKKNLSAGRVQSVATRLIVDREEEINKFKPEEYWTVSAKLKHLAEGKEFLAKLYGLEDKKLEIKTGDEASEIVSEIENSDISVKSVKHSQKKRSPAPPFITSTMQQDASRILNMSSRRTMQIAQQLYEGVEIPGFGLIGLISYMRTDSLRVSDEAIGDVRTFINEKFGDAYCPKNPRIYKSKKNAQDAHEAIRPTTVALEPDKIRKNLNNDQYKLYKLIWDRFVASQMESQVLDTVSSDIASVASSGKRYILRATGYKVRFAGYTVLYDDSKDEKAEDSDNANLPELKEGEKLSLNTISPEQHFTQPPARFNEATLIKALEENGIGRPSTYAPTISTILQREYVIKEGKMFKPTSLGSITTQFMESNFDSIVDIEFTANMEKELDEIEDGKQNWVQIIDHFYKDLKNNINTVESQLDGVRIKIPDEETDVVCELCGRNMVVKSGRYGKFLACPGYPECKNTKPITYNTGAQCPKCGGNILLRFSKNGNKYYGCENAPKCDFMTWYEPAGQNCEICGKTLLKKTGFKGRYTLICSNESCPNHNGVTKS